VVLAPECETKREGERYVSVMGFHYMILSALEEEEVKVGVASRMGLTS